MPLETGSFIDDLVATNPAASDGMSQGDDHLRLIKALLLATFPNIAGEVTPTHTVINTLDTGIATASIGNLQVTAGKLAADAVTTAKILDANVTLAKLANLAEATFIMRAAGAGTGVPIAGTAAQARTALNVADGANAYVHPNHSGDVTSVADGATTIAANAVTTAKILDANVTLGKLAPTAKAFQAQLLHVQDRKTTGVAGAAITSGAKRTRELTTAVTNEITDASLASNQITLPAGTYWVEALVTAGVGSGAVQHVFANVTDGTDPIYSVNAFTEGSAGRASTNTVLRGRMTIAGAKVFELRSHVTVTCNAGAASSLGPFECYADIVIFKIA